MSDTEARVEEIRERLLEMREHLCRVSQNEPPDAEHQEALEFLGEALDAYDTACRERDEAMEHLRNVVDACEQHADEIGPYGECAGNIWDAQKAEEWLDKKGPADDS